MTGRFDGSGAPGGRAAADGVVPSTLEAVVMQLRAALAIAEAALDQDVTVQPTVYTVADSRASSAAARRPSGDASTPVSSTPWRAARAGS